MKADTPDTETVPCQASSRQPSNAGAARSSTRGRCGVGDSERTDMTTVIKHAGGCDASPPGGWIDCTGRNNPSPGVRRWVITAPWTHTVAVSASGGALTDGRSRSVHDIQNGHGRAMPG